VISATTRADAAACLGELRAQILAGRASFADLAAQHSDCSSARCNHFPRKKIRLPYESMMRATYGLSTKDDYT
ncbi:hypothetical protein ZWY2020_032478, partial [Hordeum vulgare]